MNILVTCHSYYPNNDGVQFVTQLLCEGLSKKGHSVTVVTNYYENRGMRDKECHNGVCIIRTKAKTVHKIHTGDKNGYVELIKKLADQNDAIVNVCTQCATTDWLLPHLDEIKIPKILYLHSMWDFGFSGCVITSPKAILARAFGNIRWNYYYKKNGKNFKKYNCVIQLHEKDPANRYFKEKYNIDSEILENSAESIFFNDSHDKTIKLPDNYIINVSNFSKLKNQLFLVKTFLNDGYSCDCELILIGSERNKYSKQIEKEYYKHIESNSSNRKKVHILYGIPRSDIPTYVKGAKVFVTASKCEKFPITILESMASGIPYISSNVGIVKYLSGGVVFNSKKEYSYWLKRLLNNDEERERYGRAGKNEALKKYSPDDKTERFEKIIKGVIKRQRLENEK